MGGYDDWLTIIGFGAVFALGYYLHTRGTFNEAFDGLNKILDELKAGKSEPEEKKEEEKKSKFAYVGESGFHRAYISY